LQLSSCSCKKNVANYLQQTSLAEGYLVAKTVRTRRKQTIKLPPAFDLTASDTEDQKTIQAKDIKTIANRQLKLVDALKKGYATVYDQCSQEMRDKLKATED
jgi:hypothetical protein